MPDKGSLRSIKGARQKKKTFEAEVREGLAQAGARMQHIEENLAKAFRALKEVVNASNAASLVVASVEGYLDKEHPGWDDGVRENLKKKRDRMIERRTIHQAAAVPRKPDEDPAVRREMAEKLWEVAKELGTEVQDGTIAISLYLQAREPEKAKDVLDEVRGTQKEVPPELKVIFDKLDERIDEVRRRERRLWVPGDGPPTAP